MAGVMARSGIAAEVDCVKLMSPLYCAVRLTFPVGKVDAV